MEYDIIFIHPPSVLDFRSKPWFPGPIARTVHFTPAFLGIPIGLISMADYAERNGFRVRIFNLAEHMVLDRHFDVNNFVEKLDSPLVGIDLHFCVHSQGALELAKLVNQYHKDTKIIIGGLTATIFSKELIEQHPYVDYVIKGEAEEPILRLLQGVEPSRVPNLLYKKDNRFKKESSTTWISQDLNDFDYTRLDLVTPNKLLTAISTELGVKRHWMVPLYRGCYYNCASCGGSRHTYRKYCGRSRVSIRDPQKVVDDLRSLHKQNIESVFLFMDPRGGGRKYSDSLLDLLASEDIGVKHLTMELFTPGNDQFLRKLTKINDSVSLGLSISPESGCEEVRRAHGRGYSNTSLLKTAMFCRENGLGLGVFFMFGLAHETWETLNETFNLFKKLDKINYEAGKGPGIRVQFGEMLLLDPGSPAFNEPTRHGYKLVFHNLRDYSRGMASPAWTDWLSYETFKLKRQELLETPIRFRDKLVKYYKGQRFITGEQASFEYTKNKIDMFIVNELEKIRKIVDEKTKQKSYRKLYDAIRDYDNGRVYR